MPLIPFVKNGFFGSLSWVPLVNGNGLTAGGGEPEPPVPVPTYTTVTGIAPLALIGAIQHDIRLLKQFGKCTQASTPTPSDPVDIVCNNGKLAYGVYSTNLCNPAYYQGDGWFVGPNNTVASASANGTLLFPCKAETTYSWWHTAGAGGCRAFELPTETVTQGQEAYWAIGNPAYNDANVIRKYTTSATAKLLCICFGRDATGVGRTIEEQLADFMLVEGDISTATPYEPYKFGLYTVGTPEVLTVSGANLFNAAAVVDDGKYINANNGNLGTPSATGGSFVHSDFIHVTAGTALFFGQTSYKATGAGIAFYSDVDFDAGTYTYLDGKSGTWLSNNDMTVAVPNGAKYLRFSIRIDEDYDTNWQNTVYLCEVVDGSPLLSAYQPYVAPQTATVPNLFAVGSYADTAELIHGLLTHKVGIKVFDGTEDWGQNATYKRFTTQVPDMVSASTTRSLPFLSTHFVTTYSATTEAGYIYNGANNTTVMITHDAADVATFKAWLKAQYDAGTPVIVLYQLATETTEQSAAHSLHTSEGTNVVDVTASVSPVTLEAEYANGYE